MAEHFEAAMDSVSTVELAALAFDWFRWWARPPQLPPEVDGWRSWGFVTGRRYGKTRAIAEYVHREAMSGRAMRIGLMAQDADLAFEVLVDGDSGLLAVAPPWERPIWERGRVLWPNGAQAFIFTPVKPDGIRGPGVHLMWCSEIIAWPVNQRDKAWRNARIMASLGYARVLYDTTPKRRHPIIRSLLARAVRAPRRHQMVRGRIYDNVANLNPDQIEDLEEEFGGTSMGRQELDGDYLDDEEAALFKQKWIDDNRRALPPKLTRRVLAVDPAISTRRNTDDTGIVDCGTGPDGQHYVIEDLSDRHGWDAWGDLVVERVLRYRIDCVVVERNRGGDAVVANLRRAARERSRDYDTPTLGVELLDPKKRPQYRQGVIYIKEVIGYEGKQVRAEPVSPLYERGRVSHVVEADDLEELEEQLTTWEPGDPSPNAMDALVWCMWELAELYKSAKNYRHGFVGLKTVGKELKKRAKQRRTVGGLLPKRGGRSATRI